MLISRPYGDVDRFHVAAKRLMASLGSGREDRLGARP